MTPTAPSRIRAVASALAFAVLVAGGVVWGVSRASSPPPIELTVRPVLQVAPGAASVNHRFSFTLGRPSRITLRVTNPARTTGTLQIGPPTVAPDSSFDTVDPAHARTIALPAATTHEAAWIDLSVGTRVINVTLATPAPLGVDISTRSAASLP